VADTVEGRVKELYDVLADETKMKEFHLDLYSQYLPPAWYLPWEQKVYHHLPAFKAINLI